MITFLFNNGFLKRPPPLPSSSYSSHDRESAIIELMQPREFNRREREGELLTSHREPMGQKNLKSISSHPDVHVLDWGQEGIQAQVVC